MISPEFVRMMARYNAEMNRRLFESAARLTDGERRRQRGAFWGSIHGTLTHLIWGDRQWMSRFDGWEKNTVPLQQSAADERDFPLLTEERYTMDQRIECWAGRVEQRWLEGDLTWFSGAAGRELFKPRAVLVSHFFNHQTHHRGQVHAMLTDSGQVTGDTDLMLIA